MTESDVPSFLAMLYFTISFVGVRYELITNLEKRYFTTRGYWGEFRAALLPLSRIREKDYCTDISVRPSLCFFFIERW